MTQKYRVPFDIDLEDLIAEDEGKTEEELLRTIQKEGFNHDVKVNIIDMTVVGDIESLASFFMMLEGPGPSFNMEEFEEFVHEEGTSVPEQPKTPSDFPIDIALRVG